MCESQTPLCAAMRPLPADSPSTWVRLVPHASDRIQSHQDDNNLLTHCVMQVARQPAPFFILQFENSRTQRIHGIFGQLQGGLRIGEIGNVGGRDFYRLRCVLKRRKGNAYRPKTVVRARNFNLTIRRFERTSKHRLLKRRPRSCRYERFEVRAGGNFAGGLT